MLLFIHQLNYHVYEEIMDDYFQKRKTIFVDRLGWEVSHQQGKEKDQFDTKNALYVVSIDAEQDVKGGARLLPTLGSFMLKDVFPELVDTLVKMPIGEDIWESTRYFYMNTEEKTSMPGSAEIVAGVQMLMLHYQINTLVTVTDRGVERILSRLGWPLKRIGPYVKDEKGARVAGIMPISQECFTSFCLKNNGYPTFLNQEELGKPLPFLPRGTTYLS